jgi:hypothetical protein
MFLGFLGACAVSPQRDGRGALAADATGFDTNDVSILFPLPATEDDLALLPSIAGPSGGRPLLAPEAFAAVHAYTNDATGGTGIDAPEDWHVVALRFDPCAKANPRDSACKVEFRLVAQPLLFRPPFFDPGLGKRFEDLDGGLHLIFELAPDAGQAVVQELARIRTLDPAHPTAGVPLGIHPSLRANGMSGAVGQAVRALVEKFADPVRLRDVAIFENTGADVWRFAKASFVDGHLMRAPIPGGTGDAIQFDVVKISPPAVGADNLNAMIDSLGAKESFFELGEDVQARAVDAAVRISNPAFHTPQTVDCVSCHQASRALARVAVVKGDAFRKALAENPNRFVAPAGVTAVPLDPGIPGDTIIDAHAFGYRGSTVAIIDATVHDSAKVAAYLNAHR